MQPQPVIDAADPEAFIEACRVRGLRQAVIAWQREWAQVPDHAGVDYRRVSRCTLLAYRDGAILRCIVDGEEADAKALGDRLAAAGIRSEPRSRNQS